MMNATFEGLSSLVLVDILAALPMDHVVRMACLGHDRLRHISSLKWVKDRMTDVNFSSILIAGEKNCTVATEFCTSSILKRLNGKVVLSCLGFEYAGYMEACMKLATQVTGRVRLSPRDCSFESEEAWDRSSQFVTALEKANKITYVSTFVYGEFHEYVIMIDDHPEMLFDYTHCFENSLSDVFYRRALLNGRHIVDVVRSVCGPADVSEAELDRVRREATEGECRAYGEGAAAVWNTSWCGADIIVHGSMSEVFRRLKR